MSEKRREAAKKKLNKIMRSEKSDKTYKVYVKDPDTGNIREVHFGNPSMPIGRSNPKRRASFMARHNCDEKTDKTKPGYWSCRAWETSTELP